MTTAVLFAGMSFLRLGRSSHDGFPDAEVGDDPVPFVQQDVLGLDVAMHDVVAVRVVERVGDFRRQSRRQIDRELAPLAKQVAQRLPLHHGHDEEDKPAGLAGVVEGENVWMREASRHPDLAHETVAA